MKTLIAFLRGALEFRSGITSNPGPELIEAYDAGRDFAHRVTLRRFEQ